jgi:hypothetical protein
MEEILKVGDKVWVFNHLDTVSKIETVMGGKVIHFTRVEFGEPNFGLDNDNLSDRES